MEIKRGDVFVATLNPIKGREQGGKRPCLIIQNNIGNKYSPITIVAPITSKIFSKKFPTNVFLPKEEFNLPKDSTIMLNKIRTIDKLRLTKKIGSLDKEFMDKVDLAIKISLGLI